jgi:hypothetical protein
MTTTQHQSRGRPTIPEQSPRIGVPPTAAEMLQHADCINGASLDDHAGRFGTSEILDTGTFTWSYTRTTQARYLCVRAILSTINAGTTPSSDTATLSLSLTDGTTTVSSSDSMIPRGWGGELHVVPLSLLAGRQNEIQVVGYLDLDEAAGDLTASADWSVSVDVVIGGDTRIHILHAWEVPGFAIDDDVPGRGVLVGNYSRDREIVDTPLGCEELITQDDYAVTQQRTILSMAWRQQVADSTETPSCASTSYGAVSLLDEGGAVGHFRTIARALPTPGADVPIRFRVLYRMSGGTTETGQVRINTGASGGPWATASLAYTASWTWSAWVTAAHLSGADETTIEAKVSASPAVLWIAAIAVMEACAP